MGSTNGECKTKTALSLTLSQGVRNSSSMPSFHCCIWHCRGWDLRFFAIRFCEIFGDRAVSKVQHGIGQQAGLLDRRGFLPGAKYCTRWYWDQYWTKLSLVLNHCCLLFLVISGSCNCSFPFSHLFWKQITVEAMRHKWVCLGTDGACAWRLFVTVCVRSCLPA